MPRWNPTPRLSHLGMVLSRAERVQRLVAYPAPGQGCGITPDTDAEGCIRRPRPVAPWKRTSDPDSPNMRRAFAISIV